MDDFSLSNLYESKNEWSARLVTILTPLFNQGVNSIYDEACKMCKDNHEESKYLMTFQNLLARVPKWNESILESEFNRIKEKSNCSYLGDLLSCVHIIQLKILTCVRAGKEQKKIDIDIPKFTTFIHNVYINAARKIYTNIYLYEQNISPLQRQKYNRELEIIVQESIITTIRQNMPIEDLLKAYIDEHIEEEIEEEVSEKTYNVEESKPDVESWKPVDMESIIHKTETPDDRLIVSNNLSSELPIENTEHEKKAITFNDNIDSMSIESINEPAIKISNEDVSIDFQSLDNNNNDDIINLEIEEL
tara:strand:- start:6287 stop:7201 length:915 start_codon:yes stop_codon:yes gene_type:complete